MCGITGVMGHNLGVLEVSKFKDLMVLSQLRGDDGAGMIAVPKSNPVKKVNIRRTTWSSGHLVTTQDFDECIKGDVNILVGHARQPTKGGSKLENVHPHRAGNIILVHNGTMSHVNGNAIPQGESDSRMVCKAIAEVGPQKFVDNSYGAYCLVWIDLDKQTLNFLRNTERPLWLCEERATVLENSLVRNLFWASEGTFLQLTLGRYVSYSKERHKYFALPKDEHWSYPLHVTHALADATITKCEKTYKGSTGYYSTYNGDWESWVAGGNDVVPFAKDTTKNNGGFVYRPPEYRGGVGTGVDRVSSVPLVNASSIIARSKAEALSETKRKEGGSQSAIFPETKGLDYYACKDNRRITDLLGAGSCVWCEVRPLILADDAGTKKYPKIFPVRYTDSRNEYVCETCVEDKDVQRMVGIAC
jgi:hypothetical protein